MINKEPIEPRLQRYLAEADRATPPFALEERILRVVGRGAEPARTRSFTRQLLATAAVAIFAISLAVGVALRNHVGIGQHGPATQSASGTKALSIGTDGGGDWVVVRGIDIGPSFPLKAPTNILYHTPDGGRSWQEHLRFTGIYEGMSWSNGARQGVLWTFEMTTPCGPAATTCNQAPSQVLTVFATTDGGSNWTQQPSHPFGNFALTYFRGAMGWVLTTGEIGQQGGGSPIYRTTDAGATWKVVGRVATTGPGPLVGSWGHTSGVGQTNFEFADAQHGWLATGAVAKAGDSGLVETTDGGASWHPVSISAPSALAAEEMVVGYPVMLADGTRLLPVFFGRHTDVNNYVVDHHYIYSSSDGGATWSNPKPLRANGLEPTGDQWQNFYLDANHWWFTTVNQRSSGEPVAQAGPGVARTADGGKSWQVFSARTSPIILQMTFTDANNGWAFAIAGPSDTTNELLRTTDGGASWRQVQVP